MRMPSIASNSHMFPIVVKNLSLEINKKILLNNLTCELTAHGITVIMGPNGAGKSLFVRCLHGLSKPTDGSIRYGNVPVGAVTRGRQSMVFQSPKLLRRSVIENLRFVANLNKKNNQNLTGLLKETDLSLLKDQQVSTLSGGEKQRLSLTRALVSNPEILFLDEATSSLDPRSVSIIESLLKEKKLKNLKIILITHDINQAKRIADDIIFMNNGKISETGLANNFFLNPQSQEAKAFLKGDLIIQ